MFYMDQDQERYGSGWDLISEILVRSRLHHRSDAYGDFLSDLQVSNSK